MTPVVLRGDVLDVLPTLADASIDAVVCDPPYALGFMGHDWDAHTPQGFQAWCEAWAAECLRVLKPGGHLLAFGGTRTVHRLTSGIEDAGFEIRDGIDWLYGSGFPKSLDVSKAIDRRKDWTALLLLQAKVREARTGLGISQSEAARRCGLIGPGETLGGGGFMWFETGMRVPTADQYAALKAALRLDDSCDLAFESAEREVVGEVVTNRDGGSWADQVRSGMFQVGERTITTTMPATDDARRWSGWGTALKPAREPIVVARKRLDGTVAATVQRHGTGALNIDACRVGDSVITQHGRNAGQSDSMSGANYAEPAGRSWTGRWPTNVILSHAGNDTDGDLCADGCVPGCAVAVLDTQASGTSRFYPVFRYQAKAPARERVKVDGVAHPTVKPLTLMRWLVQLVTPPGGHVLDPFAGSGTTVEACLLDGYQVTAVENHAPYLPLIDARIARATGATTQ